MHCSVLSVSIRVASKCAATGATCALSHSELAAVRQADVMRDEMLETLTKLDNGEVPARRKVRVLLERECAARSPSVQRTRSLAGVAGTAAKAAARSSSELQALLGHVRDGQGLARTMIVNSARRPSGGREDVATAAGGTCTAYVSTPNRTVTWWMRLRRWLISMHGSSVLRRAPHPAWHRSAS